MNSKLSVSLAIGTLVSPRRGGRTGRGDFRRGNMAPNPMAMQFDPNNPLAAFMAMQQAMGFAMPNMTAQSSGGSAPPCVAYENRWLLQRKGLSILPRGQYLRARSEFAELS